MEARSLLTALRAAGRTVAVVGDQLVIEGPPLTAALRSAVVAQRSALLELLAEPDREPPAPRPAPPASQAEIAPVRASWAALAEPPPPPASSLLPLAPRVAGIAVATPETLRWMALRDAAAFRGERFDLPPPRYRYPEFERGGT
jgi:hypothetical protein